MSKTYEKIWQSEVPNKKEQILRIAYSVWQIVNRSRLRLFSLALTYQTLLAIVPLLAVLFTLLKSFGIESFLKRLVTDMLKPMGQSGDEVAVYLFQFINNVQTTYLGGVGVIFLFYSVFTLFNRIELALNHLWSVPKTRPLSGKVLNYLGVIMLTVIIATAALLLKMLLAVGTEIQHFAWLFDLTMQVISLLLIALILALIYSAAINTEVSFHAAFVGGLVCALCWLPLTTLFAKIIALSNGYSLIYSGFAGAVILLVWLNILWTLFLSGSLVAYFVQFPALLKAYGTTQLNPATLEFFALRVMHQLIEHFNAGKGALSLATLMSENRLSHQQMQHILAPFLAEKMIVAIGHHENDYLLAVSPITLTDSVILNTIRGKVMME